MLFRSGLYFRPSLDRYLRPFVPALNCGVVGMTELAGHFTDSAEALDHFPMGFHSTYVRCERTNVNVENERLERELWPMPNDSTLGEQLRALVERSGLSYDAIARKAGYKGRSSVQRYFDPGYDDTYLPLKVAEKLADGFDGSSVGRQEIMALAGVPASNASVLRYEGASQTALVRDVPVFGTALGAPRTFNGNAVEQTTLNTGDVITYLPRPTVLNGQRDVYGLYIQGSSMAPRYEEGETVFAQKGHRPPGIGDDVVVYLRDEEADGLGVENAASAVLIKRLVRRTAQYTELEQFNPPLTFRVEADRILRIDRVIPWSELLS